MEYTTEEHMTTIFTEINDIEIQDESSNLIFSKSNIINGIYYAIGTLGIIANGFVIIVFLVSKKLRKFTELTNVYLLNQSILDMSAAVFLLLLTLFESHNEKLLRGFAGELYCRLWLNKLPLWSILVSSTFNLVILNIERYLGILHPIWHKNYFTQNMMRVTLLFIWTIGLIYNASYLLPTSFIDEGACFFLAGWSPLAQQIVGVLTAVIQFFLPVSIHALCCIRIVHFLNQRVNKLEETQSNNQNLRVPETAQAQHTKKKKAALHIRNQVLKTLALMTVCFITCWVWNQVLFFLASVGVAVDFQGTFYHFTVIAVYMNCFTSPFVYVVKYPSFRQEAMRIFLRREPNSVSDITGTGSQTGNTS